MGPSGPLSGMQWARAALRAGWGGPSQDGSLSARIQAVHSRPRGWARTIPPMTRPRTPTTEPDDPTVLERALVEVKKVIVGHDRVVERLLTCLLARGHCLVEGPPGLAKTLAVSTLAEVSGGS